MNGVVGYVKKKLSRLGIHVGEDFIGWVLSQHIVPDILEAGFRLREMLYGYNPASIENLLLRAVESVSDERECTFIR